MAVNTVVNGIKVERCREVVTALEWMWGCRVELGQEIISTGRVPSFPPKGAVGCVLELEEPYTDVRTSDVIIAVFDGIRYRMKVKDFELLEK